MANIKEVSQLAGVSVATVSRVLNRSGYVHRDTEQKVLKAIETLNYKPNLVARSLSNKKTRTIGLMVPDIMNPFFPELARAVEDVMQLYGYTTILCNSDEKAEKEKQYVQVLEQKYIEGLILVSSALSPEEVNRFEVPVVAIDRTIASEKVPTVTVNNREGAQQAVRFLLDRGYRKIAHLRGPSQLLNAEERCRGYLDIVEKLDWFHPGLIVSGDYEMKQGAKATEELIQKHPDVDAIFAANDLMAIGAIRTVQKLGLPIPEKMAVVGYDGIGIGGMILPELTTMAQPIYDMGALAARMLIRMIEKHSLDSMHHEVQVQLIERGTTRR
ncbi:LacI family DNA-binding transcriptional regulator [Paludifilum halophilum]|uniref:Transcriptional regulator n=1 Tax=Paludifilum halophilum TaxID=1642702 RepID=A0A235B4D4_9BACL|nr:LacI family DNA-binding transcriptional regulator [Paludifilum halophilum]OYD07176.1 transcriptional regulator [Paludifilum halophilum]